MIDHLGVLDNSINSDVSENKMIKSNVRKKSTETESGITSKRRRSVGMKMITHIQ